MTAKMDFKNYRCKDCSLVISKCHCGAIDICKKTDMITAFLKWDGEYINARGDKKLRNEFFEYFKPKPKIKFIKKKQVDCRKTPVEEEKCEICDRNAYHKNDWHCSQGKKQVK